VDAQALLPPNSTQKPTRPGFGPPAEPARSAQLSRRHATRIARLKCRRVSRRIGFGTRALAAQLNVLAVRRTSISVVSRFHRPASSPRTERKVATGTAHRSGPFSRIKHIVLRHAFDEALRLDIFTLRQIFFAASLANRH
jgi:hypothetical protein